MRLAAHRGFRKLVGKGIKMHPHDHTPIVSSEGTPGYYEVMETAVRELLIEKGVLGAGDRGDGAVDFDQVGRELVVDCFDQAIAIVS